MTGRKIRVLIVDDSALVRRILTDTLSGESDIEVVGTAPDPIIAIEKIANLRPDVLTLDVEMPRMDGLTFLKKLMREQPFPVIMISSLARQSSQVAVEALSEGAVEVIGKPDGPYSVGDFRFSLAQKVRGAANARVRRRMMTAPGTIPISRPPAPRAQQPVPTPIVAVAGPVKLVAIGASTGGTEAIERILRQIPAAFPPIVIVQHIPAGFSRAFADRLNQFCAVRVREASDSDAVTPGVALVAPGNFHMRVSRSGGRGRVAVADGPLVCYQRPAVDVMFDSIAEQGGAGVVAVLLTGMGSDGALGMMRLKQAGARTIAQDEQSCAVFGMPREAIRMGAADEVLPLDRIAGRLIALASGERRNPVASTQALPVSCR